ncbi:MAG TPA: hypothetical protein VK473_02640 [Terriglobales bacterium]|nr:hypothetical protein [Terriglobales bacterium]
MKRLLGLTLSMLLALPVLALAQSPAAQSDSSQPAAQSQSSGTMGQSGAKAEDVKGTISQDGKTLAGDDGKSWTIANPDAVKGHEGHHVVLKGSADASTNQIQVSSVKMAKDKGSKKDSSQPQ